MNGCILIGAVIALLTTFVAVGDDTGRKKTGGDNRAAIAVLHGKIDAAVIARQAEFGHIDAARKERLKELSRSIRNQIAANKPVRLLFVCTHNSRRSHMAQIWAAVAAEVYGIRVATYSGGAETSAFNRRAAAAMERAGFKIEKTTDDDNPVYHLRFSDDRPALTCFSKKYDSPPNPKGDFTVVMVCADADRSCPNVAGASSRVAIPYRDPKISDDTPQETAAYDERCAQIAREMLYVMSRVAE